MVLHTKYSWPVKERLAGRLLGDARERCPNMHMHGRPYGLHRSTPDWFIGAVVTSTTGMAVLYGHMIVAVMLAASSSAPEAPEGQKLPGIAQRVYVPASRGTKN